MGGCSTPRQIVVNFKCDPSSLAPQQFTVTEISPCVYAWDFPTSAVCGGSPHPFTPDSNLIADRNFGCGHISCGWMFIIMLVLLVPMIYLVAFIVLAVALKRRGRSSIPLSSLGPSLLVYTWWGIKFFIPRCGAWGQGTRFRGPPWVNFHLKDSASIDGRGGEEGFDAGDYPSEGGSYQDHRSSSSMYRDDDL